MRLVMADRSVKSLVGFLCDVLVKVESFILFADFVILYCDIDFEVPIILGRPFLATRKALVDVESGKLMFSWDWGDEIATDNEEDSTNGANEDNGDSIESNHIPATTTSETPANLTIPIEIRVPEIDPTKEKVSADASSNTTPTTNAQSFAEKLSFYVG
ncbi:uncharacterized protein LOC125842858 [Solanum stenotomum]|uniref:uncharacterized protein LOC125842858 n=1 Tax=Solanum stenotomum TaxID=172797 RepID=UPI0020D17E30|nr:uncharacterized protein LOC125842858 [Solanum stenotomum]